MIDARSSLANRAEELRLAFDRSFAEVARRDTTPLENLLAFRLGSEPYAVRLSEIAGLFANRKITRLPGGTPGLLGIAGFRGSIVPVYNLHALLGQPSTETPGWLTVAAGAPVAFAFEAFDGHLRIPRDAIVLHEAGDDARNYVREFIATPDLVRPIVHLPAILDAITKQSPETAPREERQR